MRGESTSYVHVDQHMVDSILKIECLKECRAWAQTIHAYMDTTPRGGLHFDSYKILFNVEEDNLLNDEEEIYMVDIIALL